MLAQYGVTGRNPLKIRASLGPKGICLTLAALFVSQSLKDQGKSRTSSAPSQCGASIRRNPLKIRASLGHDSYTVPAEHAHVAIP